MASCAVEWQRGREAWGRGASGGTPALMHHPLSPCTGPLGQLTSYLSFALNKAFECVVDSAEIWGLSRGSRKSYVNNLKSIAEHLCSKKSSLCRPEFLTGAFFSLGVWSLILCDSRWVRRSAPSLGSPASPGQVHRSSAPTIAVLGENCAHAQLRRSRRGLAVPLPLVRPLPLPTRCWEQSRAVEKFAFSLGMNYVILLCQKRV